MAKVEAMHEDGVANVVESEARRGGKAFWADVHGRMREQQDYSGCRGALRLAMPRQ